MDMLFAIFPCLLILVAIYQSYTGTASRSQHNWHAGIPDNPGLTQHDDDWLRQNPPDPFDDWTPAEPVSMHADSGWTCGSQGYGYYSGGIRIDD